MKNRLFLPVGILALSWLTACDNNNETTSTTSDTTTSTMTTTTAMDGNTSGGMRALSETDTYTDLKTGKTFRIRRDASSGRYVSESGDNLDDMYFLNPNTHDTFYGSSGRWVNNALNYDAEAGSYSVDEARWNQMNAQSSGTMGGESGTMMDADKVKMNDEEYKAKSEDGDQKVKITDDETKMKSGDAKIKANENETKVKSGNMKVKATEDEVKVKQR